MTTIALDDPGYRLVRHRALTAIAAANIEAATGDGPGESKPRPPADEGLADLTKIYVQDGWPIDGGLLLRGLDAIAARGSADLSLAAAHRVLAAAGRAPGKADGADLENGRILFLREQVKEVLLTPFRQHAGVATLLALMHFSDRLGPGPEPVPWPLLAYRLALPSRNAGLPNSGAPEEHQWRGLRRDAFHLAADHALAGGGPAGLAGQVLASTWPARAKAALIRRLWQASRTPWRMTP